MARVKFAKTIEEALALRPHEAEAMMELVEDTFVDQMEDMVDEGHLMLATTIFVLDLVANGPNSPFGEAGWRDLLPAEIEIEPETQVEKDFD